MAVQTVTRESGSTTQPMSPLASWSAPLTSFGAAASVPLAVFDAPASAPSGNPI
jgi:hypothetical protein